MPLSPAHIYYYYSSGSQAAPAGLLADLLQQPGNGSANIKIKVASTHVPATYGNWDSVTAYNAKEIRAYPTGSPVMWKSNASVSAGESPPPFNAKWDLDIALDMIQDSGDGVNFYRTTLQKSYDDFVRINNFQYGTYANASFQTGVANLDGKGAGGASSATNIAVPTSHPATRNCTITTSRDYIGASTLGSISESIAIPTSHPAFATYNIGAGHTLDAGDTVTFKNDATHFFVFTIVTYNSSTGAAYGFSALHVGTGTFASWDIIRQDIFHLELTSSPTSLHFQGLVESYDSGTGAMVLTSTSNTGTGTAAGWNVRRYKQSVVPTATQRSDITSGLACWFTGSITGTRFSHNSIKSTSGTGWRYILLTGPNAGQEFDIDTYNASTVSDQSTKVAQNLIEGTHTFIAVSIVSPSGLSTNTSAYIYSSTNTANIESFNVSIDYDLFTVIEELGIQDPQSAGEVAWRFKLNGSAHTTQWFPYHGTITDRGDTKVITVDGVAVSQTKDSAVNPYFYKYQDFTTARIQQTGAIIHPEDAGDFAEYSSVHTLNRYGLEWDITFEWLKAALIETGYNNMVSLDQSFFNKSKSEDGVYMNRPADNTSVNMANDFKNQSSYLFYSTSVSDPQKDLVLALYWPDVSNWRAGLPNAGTSFMQDFTGSAGAKFYPLVYSNYVTTPGEIVRVRGRHYLGKWEDANLNL